MEIFVTTGRRKAASIVKANVVINLEKNIKAPGDLMALKWEVITYVCWGESFAGNQRSIRASFILKRA